MRITPPVRGKLNKAIYALATSLRDDIPLRPVFDILASENIIATQEDGSQWSGILCGREGNATFPLAKDGQEITNAMLVISWLKFDTGRYEFNAYVS